MTDRKALQKITRINNPRLERYYQEYIEYLKQLEAQLVSCAADGKTYFQGLCWMHFYASFKKWCDDRDLDLILSTIPGTIMNDERQVLNCVISWHSRTVRIEPTESY